MNLVTTIKSEVKIMDDKKFLDFLSKRRSIRAFKEDTVDESRLDKILEACNLSPSSGGLQTFEIYRIKNRKMKERLGLAARDQSFVSQAPLVLVFCANPSRSVERYGERSQLFSVQDATIAAAYAQLTVHALGLSTVWIGAFDETKVSEILKLPQDQRPIAILPIGYENEIAKEKVTRGSKNLIHTLD